MAIKSTKLGPGRLTFGETGTPTEFGSQITNARIEPSYDSEDPIPVLSGEELAGDETATYVLAGTFLQDYTGMSSLIVWCKENEGAVLPFTFVPSTDGGLQATGTVKIRAVTAGGDVKTRNTSDFEFPGVGDYAYTVYGTEPIEG